MPAVPTIILDSLDVNLLLSGNIPQTKIIDGGSWSAPNPELFLPTSQACNKLLICAGVSINQGAHLIIQMPNYEKSSSVFLTLKAGGRIFINTNWDILNTSQIIAQPVNYVNGEISNYIFFQ